MGVGARSGRLTAAQRGGPAPTPGYVLGTATRPAGLGRKPPAHAAPQPPAPPEQVRGPSTPPDPGPSHPLKECPRERPQPHALSLAGPLPASSVAWGCRRGPCLVSGARPGAGFVLLLVLCPFKTGRPSVPGSLPAASLDPECVPQIWARELQPPTALSGGPCGHEGLQERPPTLTSRGAGVAECVGGDAPRAPALRFWSPVPRAQSPRPGKPLLDPGTTWRVTTLGLSCVLEKRQPKLQKLPPKNKTQARGPVGPVPKEASEIRASCCTRPWPVLTSQSIPCFPVPWPHPG